MITEKQITLYDRVVEITVRYLGPAAERFVARQIEQHIGKEPTDLTADDLEKLVDWIRLAITLLTDDSDMVDEYTESLLAIAKKKVKAYGKDERNR